MRIVPPRLLGLMSLIVVLAGCGVAPTTTPVSRSSLQEIVQATIKPPAVELDSTHRPVAGLTLSIEPLGLFFTAKGQSQTVRVVARDAKGNIVRLKKKAVTWRIGDPKLAKLGNRMGKSEVEPEDGDTLDISTNRDDDGNAISLTAGITNN